MVRGRGTRRRSANVDDVHQRDEIDELKRSNENLQRLMEEILRRLPTQDGGSNFGGGFQNPFAEEQEHGDSDDSSSGTTTSEHVQLQSAWAMERLAKALENADKSIRVDVADFYGKLNPESYCDWIASLETFFQWKDMAEDRKVKFVATKLQGTALTWWQEYQQRRERKGLSRINTWAEMKLKLDDMFLPPDFNQTLYLKFHHLRQRQDQSVVEYTEEFYKLLRRLQLHETDDQLVARYLSGLKQEIHDELLLHHLRTLEECYQLALKAEEKLRRLSSKHFVETPGTGTLKGKSVAPRSFNQASSGDKRNAIERASTGNLL